MSPSRRPPAIGRLLETPLGRALASRHGRGATKEALVEAAERYRRSSAEEEDGDARDVESRILTQAAEALAAGRTAGPPRVVNATGVLLHTNLGRAPLAAAARQAVLEAAGACALELDLSSGARGRRGDHVRAALLALFAPPGGAFDALAVGNNAAALVLALDTLANGRRVAVSRGELVAIGGDFRVPSIVEKSGATLLEVGTTNRTTLADYADALDAGAGTILKVHPSNYRIVGFAEEVPLPPLARLAKDRRVPFVYDAGSAAPEGSPFPG